MEDPLAGVAAGVLDLCEHVIDAAPFPLLQQGFEERRPVGELAVEAALADAESGGQGLDPHRAGAAGCERGEAGVEPAGARGLEGGWHDLYGTV